jgi:hypothetical protein
MIITTTFTKHFTLLNNNNSMYMAWKLTITPMLKIILEYF